MLLWLKRGMSTTRLTASRLPPLRQFDFFPRDGRS